MSGFADAAGRAAGLLGDDVVTLGARLALGGENKPKKPRIRRISPGLYTQSPGGSGKRPVVKQENVMTTKTPEELKATLEDVLTKILDAQPPEKRPAMLIKMKMYQAEKRNLMPTLAKLAPEDRAQVLEDYYAEGDREIKVAIHNVDEGTEEMQLAKRAEPSAGELALTKMLDDIKDPNEKSRVLTKMSADTRDLIAGLEGVKDEPKEKVDELCKAWVAADNSEMRKNILDAEMNREGHRIYGTGVQAGDVVKENIGNASTHAGAKMKGSETNSDSRIARTVPSVSTGDGAGKKPAGSEGTMPGGKGGESPNPGSGPNDTGGGEVHPAVLIHRSGTTGGLGNSQGADTAGKKVTEAVPGKKKKRTWGAAEKAELAEDLLKFAPDEMVEALGELEPDEQVVAMDLAADLAADLMAWSDQSDPNQLAKRDLDSAINEWMAEDPDTVQLKKWTAEVLGTSEDISLDMAKAIMGWTPAKPVVRVRARMAA